MPTEDHLATPHLAQRNMLRACAIALVLPWCFAASSCSAAESSDRADDTARLVKNTPPIHVEQTVVAIKDGQPMMESQYLSILEGCEGGHIPVQPLDAADVKKLGRSFLSIWYKGRSFAVRMDQWGYSNEGWPLGICRFQLTHEASELTIVKPGSLSSIDLIKGTSTSKPSLGVQRDPDQPRTAEDAKEEAAVRAELQRYGHGLEGVLDNTKNKATALGQPCIHMVNVSTSERFSGAEDCVWSGGAQWGFNTSGAESELDGSEDSIVLWREPAEGTGMRWTTESMTVGKDFDNAVFDVPANVTVRPDNAAARQE